jgi:HAD superfamily hydrolase (TIGR01490 family)
MNQQSTSTRAAFFDVDGTLIEGHAWAGVVEHPQIPRRRRMWLYVAHLPALLMLRLRLMTQVGFRDSWVRGLARMLQGWTALEVDALFAWIADDYLATRYRPDVIAILQEHKDQGDHVILISTMFRGAIQRVAERLSADAGLGTQLEVRDGVCTGRILGETCVGAHKVDLVRAYLASHVPDIDLAQAAAYADSYSDAPLLAAVGHPTATYPDTEMRKVAQEMGWAIHP